MDGRRSSRQRDVVKELEELPPLFLRIAAAAYLFPGSLSVATSVFIPAFVLSIYITYRVAASCGPGQSCR